MNQQKFNFHFFLMIFGALLMLNANAQAGGFEEYGSASYYSDTFQGKKTASGELYDKDDMTCAHSSLAYNTMVRITRMDNNKSVVVRVNDRMPNIKGKIIDLSKKAAGVIDLINDGRAKVKIEVLDKQEAAPAPKKEQNTPVIESKTGIEGNEQPNKATTASDPPSTTKVIAEPATSKPTPPAAEPKVKETTIIKEGKQKKKEAATEKELAAPSAPEPPLVTGKNYQKNGSYQVELREVPKKSFLVQCITLSSLDGAMHEVAKLQGVFPGKIVLTTENAGELKAVYKVCIGAFANHAEAEKAVTKAAKKGYPKAFIVTAGE